MEVGGVIAILVFGWLLGLFFHAAVLIWGARLTGIENRTFGKAIGTTILGSVATFLLGLLFSVVPVIGTLLGVFGGFLITAAIMMTIFKTTYGKALIATILASVISIALIGGLILLALASVGGLALLSETPVPAFIYEWF